MKIQDCISRRDGKARHKIDVRTKDGKRIRKSFKKKSDAQRVALLLNFDTQTAAAWGLDRPDKKRPLLADLITARLAEIPDGRKNKARARRVLNDFADLLPAGVCVDEIKKA